MFLKDTPTDRGRCGQRQRDSLLKHAHKGEIMALCKITLNILAKRLPVPKRIKCYSRRKATRPRHLARKTTSIAVRRELLMRQLAEALCKAAREHIT